MLTLEDALRKAAELEAGRAPREAARVLDAALEDVRAGDPALRFRALLLCAELATDGNDLVLARGVLAEAVQAFRDIGADARERLSAELRRADDLETFLTHRGCAG